MDEKKKSSQEMAKKNPCYSSYVAELVQSLLDEKLNSTFVFLPRSASAAPATQTCLGPALPHTAKKFIQRALKLQEKEEKLKSLGQFSIIFIFPCSSIHLVGILCLQGWKCGFGEAVGGVSQGHDPAQDSAPNLPCPPSPSSIYPSGYVILIIFCRKHRKLCYIPSSKAASNGLHQPVHAQAEK